jgi:hypothetical protein
VPVTNYAHLLQSSCWATEHEKYCHQALKITSGASLDICSYPRQATLTSRYENLGFLLSKQIRTLIMYDGRCLPIKEHTYTSSVRSIDFYVAPLIQNKNVYNFLFETAPRVLRVQQQYLLLHWLEQTTWDTGGYKILKLRLHYERKKWPKKFGNIQDLCLKIAKDPMLQIFATASKSLYQMKLEKVRRKLQHAWMPCYNMILSNSVASLDTRLDVPNVWLRSALSGPRIILAGFGNLLESCRITSRLLLSGPERSC